MPSPIIALVEDDEDLLDSYAQIFAQLGEVATFQRPQDLLARLEKERDFKPALLVTDYKMPGMHGIDLIDKMHSAGVECPAILISGNLEKENLLSAHNIGVNRILEKPTRKQDLLRVAQELLVSRQSQDVRNQIRDIGGRMRELFSLFRLICNEELGLQGPALPDAISGEDGSVSLNQALEDLERRLETLSVTEAELEQTLARLKDPVIKVAH